MVVPLGIDDFYFYRRRPYIVMAKRLNKDLQNNDLNNTT